MPLVAFLTPLLLLQGGIEDDALAHQDYRKQKLPPLADRQHHDRVQPQTSPGTKNMHLLRVVRFQWWLGYHLCPSTIPCRSAQRTR